MKKILLTSLIFTLISSHAVLAASNYVYFNNTEVGYKIKIPKSWEEHYSETKDYSEEEDANGKTNSITWKKLNSLNPIISTFSAFSVTKDFYWLYSPLKSNLFSGQNGSLQELCKKKSKVSDKTEAWSAAEALVKACMPIKIDNEQTFVAFEFISYPEASGYGLEMKAYKTLKNSNYAGVVFSTKLTDASASLEEAMPKEWGPYDEDQQKLQQKEGRALARKLISELMSKKYKILTKNDQAMINDFYKVLRSYKEQS